MSLARPQPVSSLPKKDMVRPFSASQKKNQMEGNKGSFLHDQKFW